MSTNLVVCLMLIEGQAPADRLPQAQHAGQLNLPKHVR